MSKAHELPRRVLVVDDEREFCDQMREAFQQSGWEVFVAYDGLEAEKVALAKRPLAVVLDLRMPKRGGIDVLHRLRKDLPWTQVVVLTGHGTEEDAVECCNQHAFKFLRKAVSPFQVVDACAEALDSVPPPIAAFFKWYEALPDPERVVYQTASGRQVTATELRDSIEKQTPEGQEFIGQVSGVAVELIMKRL